ncbi:MAG: redoxin domain-containing protein [Planctomycetes bacterium]|nr:redoxin domain-containing protein [Planctomycetota bacterium]
MSGRSFRIIAAVAVSLFIAAVVTAAPEVKTLEIGAKAPDFRLPGVDGKMHRLAEFDKAKVLVIVFTCNHCPTAQAYEERIKKLAADYKDKGVALVAISPNDPKAVRLDELGYTDMSDSLDEMKVRAKDKGYNFPYLYDGDKQEVSKAYGPVSTPHVFVFDSERKLRYVGRVDDNEKQPDKVTAPDVRNAIEALLAGKPVPVEKTKTVGCSIKWSDKRDAVKDAFTKWSKEAIALGTIDLEGVKALLKNDGTKLRLVNIWASWCGPCRSEFPDLVEIYRMYRGRDFEMIGISVDGPETKGNVPGFLEKNQASYPNRIYNGTDLQVLINTVDPKWEGAIPYTLIIKPGGEVLYRHLGTIEPLEVKKIIVGYIGRTYK